MRSQSYVDYFVKGVATILTFQALSLVFGYSLRIFLAKNLSVADYGLFYALISFFTLVQIFRPLGTTTALVKFLPEYITKKEYENAKSLIIVTLTIQFLTSFSLALLILLLAKFLSLKFFKTIEALSPLQILTLSFLLSFFVDVMRACLQAFKNMLGISIINLTSIALSFTFVTILFLVKGASVESCAIGYLIAGIFTGLLSFKLFLKTFPQFLSARFKLRKSIFKKSLTFGIPALAGGISSFIITNTDTLCLTYLKGLVSVGIYQAALPIARLLLYLVSAISTVFFPMISELYAMKRYADISKAFSLLIKFSFISILPFSAIFLCYPEITIGMVFGKKFLQAALPLQILTIAMIFQTLMTIASTTLVGIGKPLLAVKVTSICAAFNLIANIALIPKFGVVGAATATVITFFIGVSVAYKLLNAEMIKHDSSITLDTKSLLKATFSIILSTIYLASIKEIINMNPWAELIITLPTFFILYGLLVIKLRCIKKSEIELMKSVKLPKKLENILVRIADKLGFFNYIDNPR